MFLSKLTLFSPDNAVQAGQPFEINPVEEIAVEVENVKEADPREVDDEKKNEENSVEMIEEREIDISIDESEEEEEPFNVGNVTSLERQQVV